MSTTTTTRSVDAIVQEITIRAPASRVFEALIDPAQRMKWWGQKGRFETTNVESDLRPGGRWLMSGKGMGRPFKVEGVYRIVECPVSINSPDRECDHIADDGTNNASCDHRADI